MSRRCACASRRASRRSPRGSSTVCGRSAACREWHRTDNLSRRGARRSIARAGTNSPRTTGRCWPITACSRRPTRPGKRIENGDVEQSHFRFKQAVDQALRVRGSRDFADRGTYERFLAELVRQRNLTRSARFAADWAALRPLPAAPLRLHPRTHGPGVAFQPRSGTAQSPTRCRRA